MGGNWDSMESKPFIPLKLMSFKPLLFQRTKAWNYIFKCRVTYQHFLEILRASNIVHQMEVAHASQKGAFGMDLEHGGREMIDAPMFKQVNAIHTTLNGPLI